MNPNQCAHCGGSLFRDQDGDLQCRQCSRYAAIALAEALPDVEAEPVYPPQLDKQAWQRLWYKQRRDAGLCTKHGGDVKAVRQGLCAYHADKATERQHTRNKRKYDANIADGICTCCRKAPALHGYINCAKCREYIRVKGNDWYIRKGGRRKCACGKWYFRLTASQRYHAPDCPAKPKRQRTSRLLVAFCVHCGAELPGATVRRRYCDDLCGSLYRAAKTLSV